MSRILYKYDPQTGLLISSFEAEIDTRASKQVGKEVYFCPPNTTTVAPDPNFNQSHRVQKYDDASKSWIIVDDFRGMKVFNKTTKEEMIWKEIGPLPKEYTFKSIPTDIKKYVEWTGVSWEVSESGREKLLDDIWYIRKNKREIECTSDIEYNGHKIHVDPTSFNDIMLAAQEALLSGDMTTTKRWVTADNVDVQLNGQDFLAIAKLYGSRRQSLVYQSNEAWQEDTKLSNNELIELYRSLINKED